MADDLTSEQDDLNLHSSSHAVIRPIRKFGIDCPGLRVGGTLKEFLGVLTGVPTFEGERASLLKDRGHNDAR